MPAEQRCLRSTWPGEGHPREAARGILRRDCEGFTIGVGGSTQQGKKSPPSERHGFRVRDGWRLDMPFKLFVAAAIAAVFLFAPATVEASCCDQKGHAHQAQSCCDKPCCKDHNVVKPGAAEIPTMDPQLNPAPPARRTAEVWFHRPVLVGRAILQGRYVIEHDNDRMARGEPCTHLYAYHDQTTPVATFDCTHLERDRASQNVVVLVPTSDGSLQRLTEFQFAGESVAHGYPTVR
jgi:hypothetical protein